MRGMIDVRLFEELARRQEGVVARWQLVGGGWPPGRCDRALAGLRRLYDGVYVTGHAPIGPLQWRVGASLTAPRTVVADRNAGCHWGMLEREPHVVSVVRPGHGGIERAPRLTVRYSSTLDGNVVRREGIWVTTVERTLIDLWPGLHGRQRDRALRDAVRLKLTTVPRLLDSIALHAGRRGVASLRERCSVYVRLPLARCRSDAEVEGLLLLDAAGIALPRVNVRCAGEEADFSWPGRRLIIEIDGPQFHRDPLEDARKTRLWTRAGWTVRRISSDDLYADPARLLALVAA